MGSFDSDHQEHFHLVMAEPNSPQQLDVFGWNR